MQMAFIEDSIYPTWTKNLDLDSQLRFDDFPLADQFKHVANIISTPADSKRQTVITFDPVVSTEEWNETLESVYIFTVDGHIVKIGGSHKSLCDRCGSYLCGHHIRERGKSGDCSKTNGFIYQTFDHYARNGHIIKMYAYKIEPAVVVRKVWGTERTITITSQLYHGYETDAIEIYKGVTGSYPILCDNCDPTARKSGKDKGPKCAGKTKKGDPCKSYSSTCKTKGHAEINASS
jgi:hypothetical protein